MKTDLGILKKFVWREEKNFEACLNLVDSNIVKGHYAKPKSVNDSQVQLNILAQKIEEQAQKIVKELTEQNNQPKRKEHKETKKTLKILKSLN